jgi:hypothetical protein
MLASTYRVGQEAETLQVGKAGAWNGQSVLKRPAKRTRRPRAIRILNVGIVLAASRLSAASNNPIESSAAFRSLPKKYPDSIRVSYIIGMGRTGIPF